MKKLPKCPMFGEVGPYVKTSLSHVRKPPGYHCIGDECAWWTGDCCAVLALARRPTSTPQLEFIPVNDGQSCLRALGPDGSVWESLDQGETWTRIVAAVGEEQ